MNDTHSKVLWNSLIHDLKKVKFGKIKDTQVDDSSDTSSEASENPQTSRHTVTRAERNMIRNLDRRRCFVTNAYSHGGEIAHIVDNSNAGNRKVVDALRGLGIVHERFNFADISNLILMSRELHYLWDKHAAFVVVPSQNTRSEMIEILQRDRQRLHQRAGRREVSPRRLAYPDAVTYDILLFQPSLFGSPGWSFQRADNHTDTPSHYTIPERSTNLRSRPEYLTKRDGGAHVREFLDVEHVTSRSASQAVNPYLMVMNACAKLKHWEFKGVCDPVFLTTITSCEAIMGLLHARSPGDTYISTVRRSTDSQRDGDDTGEDEEEDPTTPSSANRALPGEPHLPVGPAHLMYGSSMNHGTESWVSRGGSSKARGVEIWRLEVRELSDAV